MRLTVWLFGREVFTVSTDPDSIAGSPDSSDEHLSGGTLGCNVIDAGPTDLYLGFTNGRSDE